MSILHRLTREQDARAAARPPYRLLEEAADLSAGDADSGNLLIEGDNLCMHPSMAISRDPAIN